MITDVKRKELLIVTMAVVLCIGTLVPAIGTAFEKRFMVGAGAGYGSSTLSEGDFPSAVNGMTFGAHLTYGFSDTLGINIEGNFDWRVPHYVMVIGENADGDEGYLDHHKVTRLFISSVATSLIYAVDIMRCLPFIAVGMVGTRTDQISEFPETDSDPAQRLALVSYDIGMRIGGGMDYAMTDLFSLGLNLQYDIIFTHASTLQGRFGLMLRATFVFDVRKIHPNDGQE